MTTRNIFAVGRISKGNIKIHVAPSIQKRAIAAARWFGQQDALNGQWCSPSRYFADPEMQDAYREGYESKMTNERITTLVSKLSDKERPYRATLRVDGFTVAKSDHATLLLAWEWCEAAKAEKQTEMKRA